MSRYTSQESDGVSSPTEIKQGARKAIGDQVRRAREEAGLSLRELAIKADLSFNHIARVETGRYNVTIDTLSVVAEALGLGLALVYK